MLSMIFNFSVTLEDGREFDVKADQRDVSKWELEPFGLSFAESLDQRTVSFARYLAWSASRREGSHKLTWQAWADKAVEVRRLDSAEGEDAVDPGNPAASAGS